MNPNKLNTSLEFIKGIGKIRSKLIRDELKIDTCQQMLYNFPFRSPMNTTVYSPSTIELFLTFDFSPYLRNKRGDYRRLSIDNYY